MLRRFVLDDLQRPDAGALLAPAAQEEPAVAGRREQDRAGRRQVGAGIEVFCNTDGMPEHGGVDIVAGIDVNAPHKLDELPRLGLVVAAGLVYGFADEMKGHFLTFPYLTYG